MSLNGYIQCGCCFVANKKFGLLGNSPGNGGALTFSVDYRFPVPSDYRVLLPEGWDDGRGSRTAAIRVEKPGRFSRTLTCRPAPPISEI